jgi:hypothetical protein
MVGRMVFDRVSDVLESYAERAAPAVPLGSPSSISRYDKTGVRST